MNPYSEDTLVERPAIALFGQLGWETANCFDEVFGVVGRDVPPERLYGDAATAGPGRPTLGRETPAEVVLRPAWPPRWRGSTPACRPRRWRWPSRSCAATAAR